MLATEFDIIKDLMADTKRLSGSVFKRNITIAVAGGKNTSDTIHLYTDANGNLYRTTLNYNDELRESVSFKDVHQRDHVFGQECKLIPELCDMESIIKIAAVMGNLDFLPLGKYDKKTTLVVRHNDVVLDKNIGFTDEMKEALITSEFQLLLMRSLSIMDEPGIKLAVLKELNENVDNSHTIVNCIGSHTYLMEYSGIKDVMRAITPTMKPEHSEWLNVIEDMVHQLDILMEADSDEITIADIEACAAKLYSEEIEKATSCPKMKEIKSIAAANINRYGLTIHKPTV